MDIKHFGIQVKKIRNGKGITQDELADIAEISISQLGRIERGEINTGLSTVFSIAKALKVSPHQLFHDGEYTSKENHDVKLLMDAVTSMAATDYQFITPLIETDAPLKTLSLIIKKLSDEVKENTISKDILEHVLETGNMGYWEYTENDNKVFWSNNKFKLFGLEKTGNNINLDEAMLTIKEGDKKRVLNYISELLKTKGHIDFLYTGLRADGKELDILVNARYIEHKVSREKKIIGICTVLNKFKHITETIQNDLDQLKILKNQILKIISSINHEIQLPLESISSIIELLETEVDKKKDAAVIKKLNYIKDSCNTVSDYVKELHTLAQ